MKKRPSLINIRPATVYFVRRWLINRRWLPDVVVGPFLLLRSCAGLKITHTKRQTRVNISSDSRVSVVDDGR